MKPWVERSLDEANLFNPAFLSIISYQSIKGYNEISKTVAPYVLPFLVCPLILHKRTRKSLPKSLRSPFHSWITKIEGTEAKTKFLINAKIFTPYIKESLIFGKVIK